MDPNMNEEKIYETSNLEMENSINEDDMYSLLVEETMKTGHVLFFEKQIKTYS